METASLPDALRKFLRVSGGLAFIALAFPPVVFIGYLFLIVPGMVLTLAPSAFIWGCSFALGWLIARRRFEPSIATIVALPLALIFLCAVPMAANLAGSVRLLAYNLPDKAPLQPIEPAGDILLEKFGHGPNELSCDSTLCMALLSRPGVRSVTLRRSLDLSFAQVRDGLPGDTRFDNTYSLSTGGKCAGSGWARPKPTPECVAPAQAPTRFAFTIRAGQLWPDGQPPSSPEDWSLSAGQPKARVAEVRDGAGAVVFRVYELGSYAISAPLQISDNGPVYTIRFGWARDWLGEDPNGYPDNSQTELEKALSLDRQRDQGV